MIVDDLKNRIAGHESMMVALNDRIAVLQAELRQSEAVLLETAGQKKECLYWLKELEKDGTKNED